MNSSGVVFSPDELIPGQGNDFVEGLEKLDNISEVKKKEMLELPKINTLNIENQGQASKEADKNEFR